MPLSILRIEKILHDYLQEKFPNKKIVEILEVTSLTKGWQTELYSFIYKYQQEKFEYEEELILRIYPGNLSQKIVQKEYKILEHLHELGYPVPKTFSLEQDSSFFGHSFIIMERISGEDMGEEFFNYVKNRDLVGLEKSILSIMNKLFVQLHSLKWQEGMLSSILNFEYGINNYWIEKLEQLEKTIEKDQLNELYPILEWLKENSTQVTPILSIVHGDFHPHNIMKSEDGLVYVIDWTDATIGDFREDLGWTLMLTEAYTGKEVRDLVLKSYESFRGSKVGNLEYFEVASALRRLRDIILLFKEGSEKAGIREEAIQQIKYNITHLENIVNFVKEKTRKPIPQIEKFVQSVLISLE